MFAQLHDGLVKGNDRLSIDEAFELDDSECAISHVCLKGSAFDTVFLLATNSKYDCRELNNIALLELHLLDQFLALK